MLWNGSANAAKDVARKTRIKYGGPYQINDVKSYDRYKIIALKDIKGYKKYKAILSTS